GGSPRVWHWFGSGGWRGGHAGPGFCNSIVLPETHLEPGDTIRGSMQVRLAEILAESLPIGLYRFRTTTALSVREGEVVHDEDSFVELGQVRLPASRHPLWTSYRRDGFGYRATVSEGIDPGMAATVDLEVFSLSRSPSL